MLGTIKQPYITIKLSDDMREHFLNAYLSEDKINIPDGIKKLAKNDFKSEVQVEHIIWMKEKLQNKNIFIHNLLEECEIMLPEPELIPRNPELETRVQKLKILEEERKYQVMTKNVDNIRNRHPEDTISYQVKEMNRQLIGVFQLLISVSTGWMFGFYGIELMVGNVDLGSRIILGIICACIIFIAEIYFFIKKLIKAESPLNNEFDNCDY